MLFSYTTIIIIITCIVSFISFNNDSLKNDLMFSPYNYSNNKKWWVLLTHGLIHADFLHLFFNMYVLYMHYIYLTAEGHAYTTFRYKNVLIMIWKSFIIGLHFLNEGRGERVLLLTFSVKEKARGFC